MTKKPLQRNFKYRVPYSLIEKMETGDLKMRFIDDVDSLGNFIKEQVINYISTVLIVIITLYMSFYISKTMTLYCLLIVPFVFLINYLISVGPCFVCFDEREQPKLVKKRGLKCDAIYFHPMFLNINMTFQLVHSGSYEQVATSHDLFLLKPFTDEKRFVFPLFEEYTDNLNRLFLRLENELKEQNDWYWSCRSRSYFMEIILMDTVNLCSMLKDLVISVENQQFDVITDMIVKIENSYGRIGNSQDVDFRVISEEQLIDLENPVLLRIKKIHKSSFLFDSKSPWSKYWFWKYKEPESLQSHIIDGLKNKKNIPYYLAACASVWTGGKTQGWGFKKEHIEEYISIDKAYESLIGLKNTDYFSGLPYSIKETSIAFYLWYNSDRKEHDSISKENVDSMISEWEK